MKGNGSVNMAKTTVLFLRMKSLKS